MEMLPLFYWYSLCEVLISASYAALNLNSMIISWLILQVDMDTEDGNYIGDPSSSEDTNIEKVARPFEGYITSDGMFFFMYLHLFFPNETQCLPPWTWYMQICNGIQLFQFQFVLHGVGLVKYKIHFDKNFIVLYLWKQVITWKY